MMLRRLVLSALRASSALRGPARRRDGVATTRRGRRIAPRRGCRPAAAPSVSDAALSRDLARAAILATNAGCWAGWEVNFDPRTGLPKALDDAYVPEELREWGDPPLGWETFCRDSADAANWQRTGFRVLPEAGCAADEVAVATFSWGVSLEGAKCVQSDGVLGCDTPKFPSGECGGVQASAPPFVDVRTVVERPAGGPLAGCDRVRVELKIDAKACAIVNCVIVAERRDDCAAAPFSGKPMPGSARARGLDATSVTERCGKCFARRDVGSAAFDADGGTTLALAGDVYVSLRPLGAARDSGAALDVSVAGAGLRREVTAAGDVDVVARLAAG